VGAVVGAKLCTMLVGKITGRPAAG
jgi:hypothetical protein